GMTILLGSGASFTGGGAGFVGGITGAGVALTGGSGACTAGSGRGFGWKISHPASRQTSTPPAPASSLRRPVQNADFAGAAGAGATLTLRCGATGAASAMVAAK